MCQSGVHLEKVIEVTGYHRCYPRQGCQDMEKADIKEAQGQPPHKALSLAMVFFWHAADTPPLEGLSILRCAFTMLRKGCKFKKLCLPEWGYRIWFLAL